MKSNREKLILVMECIAVIITRLLFLFLVVHYYSVLDNKKELNVFLITLLYTVIFWKVPIRKLVS